MSADEAFGELWIRLPIPGEFDAMDLCDQNRWRAVIQMAFEAGFKAGHAHPADTERSGI